MENSDIRLTVMGCEMIVLDVNLSLRFQLLRESSCYHERRQSEEQRQKREPQRNRFVILTSPPWTLRLAHPQKPAIHLFICIKQHFHYCSSWFELSYLLLAIKNIWIALMLQLLLKMTSRFSVSLKKEFRGGQYRRTSSY
jgi:hypothetical protein